VHLKVDTGMGDSVSHRRSRRPVRGIKSSPRVSLEGLCTHFAASEVLDAPDVSLQIRRFEEALGIVKGPMVSHRPLSHGQHRRHFRAPRYLEETWCGPGSRSTAMPCRWFGEEKPNCRLSPLSSSRRFPGERGFSPSNKPKAGRALGYGGTYVTRAASRIAALPVGYADGYNRGLSNRGRVIVRGAYAPIVGAISMDLTLVGRNRHPGRSRGR